MTMHGRSAKSTDQRRLRVGEELRHALAEVLLRGGIRDPALRDASVTVSEVRVSPDLRNATVYVVPLAGEAVDDVVAALRRCTPYLRGQVARLVRLKYMPTFTVEADQSFDAASRVDTLLREARDGEPPSAESDEETRSDGA